MMFQLLLPLPCPHCICGSDRQTQGKVTTDGSTWDCCLAELILHPRVCGTFPLSGRNGALKVVVAMHCLGV